MRSLGKSCLALTVAFGGAAAVWGIGEAFAVGSYKGNASNLDVTASTSTNVTFTNDTGQKICDFAVVPVGSGASGLTITAVDVSTPGTPSEGNSFAVDDDGDGTAEGTTQNPTPAPTTPAPDESNDVDSSPTAGGAVKTICRDQDATDECIDKGHTVTLSVTFSASVTGTVRWQATGPGGGDGVGGPSIGDLSHSTVMGPTGTGVIFNGFGNRALTVATENGDPHSIVSITFDTPIGVNIVNAVSEWNPGSWDPGSRTFTFGMPIGLGQELRLNILLDELGGGEETEIPWHVTYDI